MENRPNKKTYNRLWKLKKSSVLNDPESSVIGLGGGSYRLDLRDAFLIDREGGNPRALELYYALLTDPTVYSAFDRLVTLICNLTITLQEGGGDPIDLEAHQWIEELFKRKKSALRTIKETLAYSMILGLSAVEVIWDLKRGFVEFDAVPVDSRRLLYTLEVDEENHNEYYQLRIRTEQDLYEGEPVPDRKFITQTYYTLPIDSPYGLGLGQQIWWLVEFKKCALQLWVQISDRHSMPLVIGKVPNNEEGELVTDFFNSLEEMAANSTFVIPEDFEVMLQEADTGTVDTLVKDLITYCDTKINEVLLGQSTSIQDIKPGLAGAARDVRAITQQKAKRIADSIVETLNNTLIEWLTLYNFPGAKPPTLLIESNEGENMSAIADTLTSLFNIGYIADPKWIEEKFGIPPKPEVQGLGEGAIPEDGGLVVPPVPGEEDVADQEQLPGAEGLGDVEGIDQIAPEEDEPEFLDSRVASGLKQ